jgi:hypothetical protein
MDDGTNLGVASPRRPKIRAAAATGQMTIWADLGVASILIPKTVQKGIKGCFISHPKKKSSKRNQGLLQFSSPKQFKTELRVASFLILKSFHI